MTQQLAALEQLSFARRIADYAARLGVLNSPVAARSSFDHLGASLADAVLQAGVNYHTVVRTRVERIILHFPEAATLSGLIPLLDHEGAKNFLLWNHPVKVTRFIALAHFLDIQDIDTSAELKAWLCSGNARERLLDLNGIGPKTYDYLCCLVGVDCIAVDRHIRTFATDAGACISDYDSLKLSVSYAADLLGVARRDFDAWIWNTVSNKASSHQGEQFLW